MSKPDTTADRAEFVDAATAAAWTVDDPGSQDHGRILVHCTGTFTGADWDLDHVLAQITDARNRVEWDADGSISAILGHQLKVTTPNNMVWRFEVREPA